MVRIGVAKPRASAPCTAVRASAAAMGSRAGWSNWLRMTPTVANSASVTGRGGGHECCGDLAHELSAGVAEGFEYTETVAFAHDRGPDDHHQHQPRQADCEDEHGKADGRHDRSVHLLARVTHAFHVGGVRHEVAARAFDRTDDARCRPRRSTRRACAGCVRVRVEARIAGVGQFADGAAVVDALDVAHDGVAERGAAVAHRDFRADWVRVGERRSHGDLMRSGGVVVFVPDVVARGVEVVAHEGGHLGAVDADARRGVCDHVLHATDCADALRGLDIAPCGRCGDDLRRLRGQRVVQIVGCDRGVVGERRGEADEERHQERHAPTSRLRAGDAAACCRLTAVRALPGMRPSARIAWRRPRASVPRIASIGCSARKERTPIHANSSVTPASAAMVMSQARVGLRMEREAGLQRDQRANRRCGERGQGESDHRGAHAHEKIRRHHRARDHRPGVAERLEHAHVSAVGLHDVADVECAQCQADDGDERGEHHEDEDDKLADHHAGRAHTVAVDSGGHRYACVGERPLEA